MRYQGTIKAWKDDKGFGFISPNGGGTDIFLHISKFTGTNRRPAVGDSVTFEVVSDNRNRKQGVNVMFVGRKIKPVIANRYQLTSLIVPLLILSIVVYIGYIRLSHPGSTIQGSVYKAVIERFALHNGNSYQCTGKKYCSQMNSCSEALFYQENCPGTQMDPRLTSKPLTTRSIT